MRVKCIDTNKCKEALAGMGKVQQDLTELGLSASAVSKFFRGISVSPKTAAPIVKKLRLKLLGRDGVAEIVGAD